MEYFDTTGDNIVDWVVYYGAGVNYHHIDVNDDLVFETWAVDYGQDGYLDYAITDPDFDGTYVELPLY